MGDDIRAVLERAAQHRGRHGVVDDQRNAAVMRDIGDRRDVGDDAARIGQALDEDAAGLVVHRRAHVLRLVDIDETGFPAELAKRLAHLVERSAIQLARRDDVAPRLHQRVERDQLRRMPARHAQRADAAFQRGNLAFQRVIGGVHDARIDVPELLQREQVCGMLGAVEDIACRLVDRRDPRIGRGIGLAPGVHGHGFEFVVGHRVPHPQCSCDGPRLPRSCKPIHGPDAPNGRKWRPARAVSGKERWMPREDSNLN